MTRSELENLRIVLQQLAIANGKVADGLSLAEFSSFGEEDRDWVITQGANRLRLRLSIVSSRVTDLWETVRSGYPVAFQEPSRDANATDTWWVLDRIEAGKLTGYRIAQQGVETVSVSSKELQKICDRSGKRVIESCYVSQPFLGCEYASQADHESDHSGSGHHHQHHAGHKHWSPIRRLWRLLRMDSSDILSLVIYGFAAGVLGLASPLAVEWVVTTIGFGRYLQPLIVLSILLFTFMAFSGAMRIMQAIVVELMQRRLMVRMVGDLAYRLPHVRHAALHGENGQEMMNRFLDVPTIQKALASLLLEGITLVLTTIIGMVLLAFYHPFLLGFDIVLLFCMTFVTYVLGRGGVRTAIRESITKYKIVHWLQEIISYPTAFRLQGGLQLALDRANRLSAEYVSHRREHFSVLVRQILFAVSLQAMALTALILLGGWLVLQGQLTLGQWVASELVIGVIVGAFAKIGKSIETYFDLLAAVDKVGHLLDLEPDSPSRFLPVPSSPASVRWKELEYHCEHQAPIHFGSGQIQAGARIQLKSHEGSASEFLYLLCGLRESSSGILDIDGIDAREAARLTAGRLIGMAVDISIFQGSILENVSLRRSFIGMEDVRWSLEQVGLGELLLRLPQGVETMLSSQGGWLNQEQKIRLMIARAIVSKPKLLAIDLMLDQLSVESRASIIKNLCDPSMPWTLVVVTNHDVLGSSATSHTFTDDHHTNHTHA